MEFEINDTIRTFVYFILFIAGLLASATNFVAAIRLKRKFLFTMVPGFILFSVACLLLAISLGNDPVFPRDVLIGPVYLLLAVSGVLWIINSLLYLIRFW